MVMTMTKTTKTVALAHTAVVVSLVLHTGWPGLAHCARLKWPREYVSRFLFLSRRVRTSSYPRPGQRLGPVVIFIVVVVVVVVVVVALSLHSRNHVAN